MGICKAPTKPESTRHLIVNTAIIIAVTAILTGAICFSILGCGSCERAFDDAIERADDRATGVD